MRKQDQLNALIRGLSKSEKRYFKLQASLHSGNKTFTRLFDELSKSDTYDPEQLSKKLNISKPLLGHSKKYLEKVLLGALRLYEQDNDLRIWLNNQWQVVRVLYTRHQYELALSVNEKALEKALAYDNFSMAIEFLSLKYNLLALSNKVEEAQKAKSQRMLACEQRNELDQLSDINTDFSAVAGGGRDTQQRLKRTEQNAIFKAGPEKLKSNSARMLWHEMKQNYYYYVKHDLNTAIQHSISKLNTFEIQPPLIEAWPNAYLIGLVYLSSHYGELGNYEEGLKYARALEYETDESKGKISPNFRFSMNLVAHSLQVILLSYQDKYADAAKKGAAIAGEMNRLQPSHFIMTKHHHALALFYTGKYDEAKKVCEELQSNTAEVSLENLLANKILLVMIHHALKNYSLLPHLAGSAATWAKRHEVKAPGTSHLIRWFRKLAKLSPAHHRDLFFTKFDNAIRRNIFKEYGRELGLKRWVSDNLGLRAGRV